MHFKTSTDLDDALATLPAADEGRRDRARIHLDRLTKPPGSLGRLEDIAVFLAGWAPGRAKALQVAPFEVFVFAGNHGIASRGVSPYPPSVTAQMVQNFKDGGAAINVLTRVFDLGLRVEALEIDRPTADLSEGPAMSVEETLEALSAGARAVDAAGPGVVIVGEMGIGNTTVAAALANVSFGGAAADWVGPGTGLDSEGQKKKAALVEQAVARTLRELGTMAGAEGRAFALLRHVGGREQAAIAGAVLRARQLRIPVILDGYVATAAIAPLVAANPEITRHCLAGHVSAEPAHGRLLQRMGLEALLDLDMRLGEGTGAALAAGLVRAAAELHNTMATFESAAVENRTDAGKDTGNR